MKHLKITNKDVIERNSFKWRIQNFPINTETTTQLQQQTMCFSQELIQNILIFLETYSM